ncbi:hypothetical protein N7517_009970 [Penicillium concentricum]|uniref:MACPF domain-containing protein n=1 Tax=Penicillium concentricum TaxID=293559 RepID=A0A9W9RK72_9EURO|nr:uncharacterized protein N7517_009970 [Penicillium concentricum]KAJ5360779.1 hypothetical protein N7517_009970 [Penicillium concentricum]
MAPLLAPYHSGMRLGSGFNSYTQQMCVDDAVTKIPNGTPFDSDPEQSQSQSVVFKTSMIEKMSEISDTLNVCGLAQMGINWCSQRSIQISGALTIKYNNLIDGAGKGTFINSNKIKDADINFMLSVKVINESIVDQGLTDFNPIANLQSSSDFTEVYGDSFISGFQEGGEFVAVVSIKVKDKNQKETIAANAAVSLTTPQFGSGQAKDKKKSKLKPSGENGKHGSETLTDEEMYGDSSALDKEDGENDEAEDKASGEGAKGFEAKGNAEVKKERMDLFQENEVTLSVTYSGGGQGLKEPDEDWNLENIRKAALQFPSLVAKNPVRTHAVLTKYTALKSYYAKVKAETKVGDKDATKHLPLCYDNADIYTSTLQEAFLDYKNVHMKIRLLQVDVVNGVKELKKSNFSDKSKAVETAMDSDEGQDTRNSISITAPMDATLASLETAQQYVRRQMDLIVKKVDAITVDPTLAGGDCDLPCQSPLIFQLYLPIGVPIGESKS